MTKRSRDLEAVKSFAQRLPAWKDSMVADLFAVSSSGSPDACSECDDKMTENGVEEKNGGTKWARCGSDGLNMELQLSLLFLLSKATIPLSQRLG